MDDMYISSNDHQEAGLLGSQPWGWVIQQSSYNSLTNETEVLLEIGYEGDTQEDVVFLAGDVTAHVETAIQAQPEYSNSAGPIRGGGFPVKL